RRGRGARRLRSRPRDRRCGTRRWSGLGGWRRRRRRFSAHRHGFVACRRKKNRKPAKGQNFDGQGWKTSTINQTSSKGGKPSPEYTNFGRAPLPGSAHNSIVDNEFLTLYGEAAVNTSSSGLSASEMVAGQFLFTTFQNCLAAVRFSSGV